MNQQKITHKTLRVVLKNAILIHVMVISVSIQNLKCIQFPINTHMVHFIGYRMHINILQKCQLALRFFFFYDK